MFTAEHRRLLAHRVPKEKSHFYALLSLIDFSPCDNNKKKRVESDAIGGSKYMKHRRSLHCAVVRGSSLRSWTERPYRASVTAWPVRCFAWLELRFILSSMCSPRPAKLLFTVDNGWNRYLVNTDRILTPPCQSKTDPPPLNYSNVVTFVFFWIWPLFSLSFSR